MYKMAIIADLHLKDTESIGGIDAKGRSLRTVDKINMLNTVANFVIKYKVDSLLIAGDLYDNHRPSNRLRNAVSRIFSKITNNGIIIYLIGGNHDTIDSKFYNMMSECNFNSNLIFARNKTINTNEKVMLKLLSWGNEYELENMKIIQPTILISHLQIDGAKYDNERLAEGFISPSVLSKFTKAYLGHFHLRQVSDYYTYIGAMCRNSFGEKSNPVGFEYITINNGDIKEQFIKLSDRRFIEIEIDQTSEPKSIEEIMEMLKNKSIDGNAIKIKITLNEEDYIDNIMLKKKILERFNPFDLKIEYLKQSTTKTRSISKDINPFLILEKFIESEDMSDERAALGIEISQKVFKE